ncbi:MAG TPA: hypothetical protein VKP88_08850, partial [Candidatus Paceibacterota bacterium]|nr:hypothetical protein [Candidatus Paceibacterota bacterium]
GEDGKESCLTCVNLKGDVHRASEWQKAGLRPGIDTDNFACGGWNCRHILRPTSEKSSGKMPSASMINTWIAASKSHKHDHDHELGYDPAQPYSEREYIKYHATKGYIN